MRRKKIEVEEEKKGKRKRIRQRKGEEEMRLCGIGRRKNEQGDKILGF